MPSKQPISFVANPTDLFFLLPLVTIDVLPPASFASINDVIADVVGPCE
jgi:hypothetical protein